MSREGVREELSLRNITVQELVYSQAIVSVYQGLYGSKPAAIKIQTVTSTADYYRYEGEFNTLLHLTHPNIIRLFDCFSLEKAGRSFVVIVSEWCSKDLGKDVAHRKLNRYPWNEEDLWDMLRSLVSTLAYMQHSHYAHRDIKPTNIFLSQSTIKLGDFGSAVFREDYTTYQSTIIGTLQYFSPALRKSFALSQYKVVHNAYKSDMYSLGLTMLHLALLDYPNLFMNCNVTRLEAWNVIQCIPYSEGLQRTIMWMVEPEEVDRCDFTTLDSYINLAELPREMMEAQDQFAKSLKIDVAMVVPVRSTEASETELPPSCLQCNKPPIVSNRSRSDPIVHLPCAPEKHIFCSKSCFLVFALSRQKGDLHCPVCDQEISERSWRYLQAYTEATLRSASHSVRSMHKATTLAIEGERRLETFTNNKTCGRCSLF